MKKTYYAYYGYKRIFKVLESLVYLKRTINHPDYLSHIDKSIQELETLLKNAYFYNSKYSRIFRYEIELRRTVTNTVTDLFDNPIEETVDVSNFIFPFNIIEQNEDTIKVRFSRASYNRFKKNSWFKKVFISETKKIYDERGSF